MYLLGYDVGSSSVKASIVDAQTGKSVATSYYPKNEAPILTEQPGWAEQEPEMWWQNLKHVTRDVLAQASGQKPGSVGSSGSRPDTSAVARDIAAIGISYQMHGLVCVDRDWSRSVPRSSGVTPAPFRTEKRRSATSGKNGACRTCSTRPATSRPPNSRGSRKTNPTCTPGSTRSCFRATTSP